MGPNEAKRKLDSRFQAMLLREYGGPRCIRSFLGQQQIRGILIPPLKNQEHPRGRRDGGQLVQPTNQCEDAKRRRRIANFAKRLLNDEDCRDESTSYAFFLKRLRALKDGTPASRLPRAFERMNALLRAQGVPLPVGAWEFEQSLGR